jgi:hypothetical protein
MTDLIFQGINDIKSHFYGNADVKISNVREKDWLREMKVYLKNLCDPLHYPGIPET